jgi:hypothetical protein
MSSLFSARHLDPHSFVSHARRRLLPLGKSGRNVNLITSFVYLLTHSTKQSPSWEANRFSASQEIPCILWNPKVHYRNQKFPPPFPIPSPSSSKGKAVPLQAWSGPEGSRKLRFPDFMTTAQDGGKVVSLTHRPLLPPGNIPGTHFC